MKFFFLKCFSIAQSNIDSPASTNC